MSPWLSRIAWIRMILSFYRNESLLWFFIARVPVHSSQFSFGCQFMNRRMVADRQTINNVEWKRKLEQLDCMGLPFNSTFSNRLLSPQHTPRSLITSKTAAINCPCAVRSVVCGCMGKSACREQCGKNNCIMKIKWWLLLLNESQFGTERNR